MESVMNTKRDKNPNQGELTMLARTLITAIVALSSTMTLAQTSVVNMMTGEEQKLVSWAATYRQMAQKRCERVRVPSASQVSAEFDSSIQQVASERQKHYETATAGLASGGICSSFEHEM